MTQFEDVSVSLFANAKSTVPMSTSLGQVLEDIQSGKYADTAKRARDLFGTWSLATDGTCRKKLQGGTQCPEAAGYDRHKKTMPGVTFSGTFSKRFSTCLVGHSGFLVADLDKLGPDIDEIAKRVKGDAHVAFGFRSPSGAGLKLGLRIDGGRHLDSFYAAESHFKRTYGLKIDPACKDVSRLCFVSHDPDLWINPDATPLSLPLLLNGNDKTAQCTEETEDSEDTNDTEVIHPVEWVYSVSTLEEAVRVSLPDHPHDNNTLLFKFARAVKAVERQTVKQTPQQLRTIFEMWFTAANKRFLRPGQTKEEYMIEFLVAYSKAKYPLGGYLLQKAWGLAKEQPLPPEALQVENPEFRLLIALCRQLQIIAGTDPFYLGSRKGARLFGHKNHSTVADWLATMRVLQIIKEVEKGGGVRASRYRYLYPL